MRPGAAAGAAKPSGARRRAGGERGLWCVHEFSMDKNADAAISSASGPRGSKPGRRGGRRGSTPGPAPAGPTGIRVHELEFESAIQGQLESESAAWPMVARPGCGLESVSYKPSDSEWHDQKHHIQVMRS